MNINPDDPKWTDYVLGELGDADRKRVEKELESSAAAREVVEEIRLMTGLLKTELMREAPLELTSTQRGAVAAASAPKASRPFLRWVTVAASVAAGLIVVATLAVPSMLRSRQAAVEIAQDTSSHATEAAPAATQDHGVASAVPAAKNEEKDATYLRTKAAKTSEYRLPSEVQDKETQMAVRTIVEPSYAPPSLDQLSRSVILNRAMPGFANSFVPPSAATPPPGAPPVDRLDRPRFNTETYDLISDNPFIRVAQDPRATFSIDVDTASYSNVRRFLTMEQLPPKDSVRIEEMINYFTYDYASPSGTHPIAAYTEVTAAPWKPDHRLVRIGIKAKDVDMAKRPPSNLVFLIDVSGSMATPEKLPMLKAAMKLMVERLGEGDHVSIVTYAGISGLQLPATSGDRKNVINAAIDMLGAGGSTNGGAGILLAYETAMSNFIRGGVNRVILATDGDFNVGVTNQGDLTRIIEEKAKSGVFLSVLGFGMGNYKDSTLEKLADKGNGNYAYIDTVNEARKVLVEEMSGTLMTVAKDVKIDVEFNPAQVNAYRLIGYENRALRHEDFNDDRKDAGDMGAGQNVTALFEVVPEGVEIALPGVDPLRYQQPALPQRQARNGEILNLRIRYKEPDGETSKLMETQVLDRVVAFDSASADFRFAAAVASFGMILRESPYKGQSTFDAVLDMAEKSKGQDRNGYREEFVRLVRKARSLK